MITLLTKELKPSCVIAVDALASHSLSRLGTTFQITDTGVAPGSGVNLRSASIDSQTLGVPVISIGVPTVVDAVTLAADVVGKAHDEVERIAKERDASLFVTPNNIDVLIESAASAIALGINLTLQNRLGIEDVESLMNA